MFDGSYSVGKSINNISVYFLSWRTEFRISDSYGGYLLSPWMLYSFSDFLDCSFFSYRYVSSITHSDRNSIIYQLEYKNELRTEYKDSANRYKL